MDVVFNRGRKLFGERMYGTEMFVFAGDPLTLSGNCVDEIVVRGYGVVMTGPEPFDLTCLRMGEVDQTVFSSMLRPS